MTSCSWVELVVAAAAFSRLLPSPPSFPLIPSQTLTSGGKRLLFPSCQDDLLTIFTVFRSRGLEEGEHRERFGRLRTSLLQINNQQNIHFYSNPPKQRTQITASRSTTNMTPLFFLEANRKKQNWKTKICILNDHFLYYFFLLYCHKGNKRLMHIKQNRQSAFFKCINLM